MRVVSVKCNKVRIWVGKVSKVRSNEKFTVNFVNFVNLGPGPISAGPWYGTALIEAGVGKDKLVFPTGHM